MAIVTDRDTVRNRTRAVSVSLLASAIPTTTYEIVRLLLRNIQLTCKPKKLFMTLSTDSKTRVLQQAFKIKS
jgi:hypothetical protein